MYVFDNGHLPITLSSIVIYLQTNYNSISNSFDEVST